MGVKRLNEGQILADLGRSGFSTHLAWEISGDGSEIRYQVWVVGGDWTGGIHALLFAHCLPEHQSQRGGKYTCTDKHL